MEQISTIRDLIALWPGRAVFAAEVGVPLARVHKWITANAIPARHHFRIVVIAQARGFAVTADLLVLLHAEPLQSEDAA
jgi:DNA-binding transcriptional regulator YiaG